MRPIVAPRQMGESRWIGFHTPDEFRHPFLDAGFARAAWIDL